MASLRLARGDEAVAGMSEEIEMESPVCEITALSTRVVYQNRWMTVREDQIQRSDGSTGIYGVVEKSDFALVIPVNADGSLCLVEQYRYPVKGRFWEFPQGSWEGVATADPLDLARGELEEETGLLAREMHYVGHLFECYGYSTQGCHIFIARDLQATETKLDPEEQGLISQAFALEAVIAMVGDGRIKDAMSIAALGLCRLKGLL